MPKKLGFQSQKPAFVPQAASRAQTSLEYLLIISGVVVLALVVFLIVSGLLNLTTGAANSTVPLYNQAQGNYSVTPTPLSGFPCAARCDVLADCTTACGPTSGYVCDAIAHVCVKP